jgi:hypothetical protein
MEQTRQQAPLPPMGQGLISCARLNIVEIPFFSASSISAWDAESMLRFSAIPSPPNHKNE